MPIEMKIYIFFNDDVPSNFEYGYKPNFFFHFISLTATGCDHKFYDMLSILMNEFYSLLRIQLLDSTEY